MDQGWLFMGSLFVIIACCVFLAWLALEAASIEGIKRRRRLPEPATQKLNENLD